MSTKSSDRHTYDLNYRDIIGRAYQPVCFVKSYEQIKGKGVESKALRGAWRGKGAEGGVLDFIIILGEPPTVETIQVSFNSVVAAEAKKKSFNKKGEIEISDGQVRGPSEALPDQIIRKPDQLASNRTFDVLKK